MPDYRYVCITPKGDYLRGEYTAEDKNELVWTLWESKLFLIWWEEIRSVPSGSPPLNEIKPQLISREEVAKFWKDIWHSKNPPIVPGKTPEGYESPRRERFPALERKNVRVGILLGTSLLVFLLGPSAGLLLQKIKWRLHYNHALQDMQKIAEAAKADYALQKDYAPQVMPGVLPPRFEKTLATWPDPPCPGWTYGWDNWVGIPGADNTVRITLRNPHLYAVYYLCISSSGDCSPLLMWSHGTAIDQAGDHYLTCREK